MIVNITEDIYSYENKVAGNFSWRQLVCIGIALAIIFPVFIVLFVSTKSVDLASFAAFVVGIPIFLFSIVKKDGQPLEKVLIYRFIAKFKYTQKRKYIMTNLYEEIQKNQKEYELANEILDNNRQQEKKQSLKKRLVALAKKGYRSKQHTI